MTASPATTWRTLAKDAQNYVMAWYNNVSHTSGFDLVQNGVLEPTGFQSYCCANVTMNAGDRFALEEYLTSPAVRAEYHYTFGLRGDSGTLAAARFEGASDPG